MPEPGWTPPSRIDASGLKVTVTDEGSANSRVIDFANLPGPEELRRQFALALERKTGPTGTWTRIQSVRPLSESLPPFCAYLDQRGDITSVEKITADVWNDFKLHLDTNPRPIGPRRKVSAPYAPATRRKILTSVAGLLKAAEGLPEGTRRALRMRVVSEPRRIQAHHSDDDFKAIQKAAQEVIYAAATRISANAALLERYGDSVLTEEEARKATALKAVMANGHLDRSDLPLHEALGAVRRNARGQLYPVISMARAALFPTVSEIVAGAVLLLCHEGYNRSVVDQLTVPDSAATAADEMDAYRTPTDKPRRGRSARHQTNILVDDGINSVGRAIRWITEATEPARHYLGTHGVPTDRLLVSWARDGEEPILGIPHYNSARYAAAKWWPDGVEAVANFAKLHRTHVTRIKRQPEHHTRGTFLKEYLLLDATAQEAALATAREGLEAALAPARKRLAIRVVRSNSDVGEQSDTAVASCGDYDHNPRTGAKCSDSFLMCLRCANALAGPRHFPRIVCLHDAMENLRSAIDSKTWAEDFAPYYLDVVAFLREELTPAQIAEARAQVTDEDRRTIERLLWGEYNRA
jgi:hypothetical protein